jgi:hypothetical protein
MKRRPPRRRHAAELVSAPSTSLLDLVDNLLNSGVVLRGDLLLGVADVDLVYAQLSVLLCAADRLLEGDR